MGKLRRDGVKKQTEHNAWVIFQCGFHCRVTAHKPDWLNSASAAAVITHTRPQFVFISDVVSLKPPITANWAWLCRLQGWMEAILFGSVPFQMLFCAFALYLCAFYSRSKQGKRNISRIRQRRKIEKDTDELPVFTDVVWQTETNDLCLDEQSGR